jgi:hypothetical protein
VLLHGIAALKAEVEPIAEAGTLPMAIVMFGVENSAKPIPWAIRSPMMKPLLSVPSSEAPMKDITTMAATPMPATRRGFQRSASTPDKGAIEAINAEPTAIICPATIELFCITTCR